MHMLAGRGQPEAHQARGGPRLQTGLALVEPDRLYLFESPQVPDGRKPPYRLQLFIEERARVLERGGPARGRLVEEEKERGPQ